MSAGVVAYLQRAEPLLLRDHRACSARDQPGAIRGRLAATRPLWIALAVLMVLTPLGILAAGSAWGEWAPAGFLEPLGTPNQIAAASGQAPPPANAPAGLQRLASFWTAPMPRYAPPFLKSPAFGYMLSAMSGTGLIILVFLFAAGWDSADADVPDESRLH